MLLLKGKTTSESFDVPEYTNTQRKQQAEKCFLAVNVYSHCSLNLDKEDPTENPQVQPEHPPRRVLAPFLMQEKCAEGQRKSPRSDPSIQVTHRWANCSRLVEIYSSEVSC